MLEKYYMYKSEYKGYVLFIKAGNFYEVIENDALIINSIFGYKVKKFSGTFKCGFPVKKLSDILCVLNDKKINYLVVDSQIVTSEDFGDNNTYKDFDFDVNKVLLNLMRIDKINNYLNDNLLTNGFSERLLEIESVLWKIS